MEKLTALQIRKIEETLDLNDLGYDDLKYELTDHIATDIEIMLQDRDIPFEKAFKTAFGQWEEELRPHSGAFWVSSNVSAPKIVMDRWVGWAKKAALNTVFASVIMTLSIACIITIYDYNQEMLDLGASIFQYAFIALGALLIMGKITVALLPYSTTFGYMYKRQAFVSLIFIFQQVGTTSLFKHIDAVWGLDILRVLMPSAMFFYGFFSLRLLLWHLKFKKKTLIA